MRVNITIKGAELRCSICGKMITYGIVDQVDACTHKQGEWYEIDGERVQAVAEIVVGWLSDVSMVVDHEGMRS